MKALVLLAISCCAFQLPAATVNVSNYAQLKAAIDANNSSASGGDVIILAPGTYTITAPIGVGDLGIAIELVKPVTLRSSS
jgi:hypothetical protein